MPPPSGSMRQRMLFFHTMLRADKARRLLLRALRLVRLDADIRPALQDASACALFTGSLRAISSLLPPGIQKRSHILIQPQFFSQRSMSRVRCIISIPLGILLITMGMALMAYLLERRERHAHIKEA